MYVIIAGVIGSIILGGIIEFKRSSNDPDNDDKFFRTARRVVNRKSQVRSRKGD